jgi:hypothetical protein
MRRFLISACLVAPALALAADQPKPAAGSRSGGALAPGKDLPGAFNPFCVTGPYIAKLQQQAGEKEKIGGRFHCPVCAHGLEPLVLLFVRDLRFGDPLKDLLVRFDAAVEKNPNTRLAVAVVFISDVLTDLVTMDDKREELAEQLRSLAATLKLKNVSLCLDSKSDLEKYDLDRDEAAYVVVLARRCQVLASEAIARDQLTPEKVDQVLKQVAEKLGASRR